MLQMIRFLLSLALLFLMLLLGKGVDFLLPIGIPDSIWGLLLLFSALVIGMVKVQWITPSTRSLTRYMMLFFLPICADIINHIDTLQHYFSSFVLANMLSTTLSLVAIGLFGQWIFHRK
ncbi:murein hydrolase transporter LrgA [[Haemophilus] ducreyi]|uniref:Murein hydrolase transporter LrgA n=1 Tax=Haemophilus ducreyi TaxID=730 RepID=A0AAC8ZAN2_HAEDC|nr:CidA/LrgA family protein [[Haemophilus] ducreyi]AKO31086.1 murein hydrolase transporter LrgA [[Haemophilus] ducreyi]AKO32530.1 murein hydrolase transporter LrgA [[Haemophilus] ducreyi]AKO33981.1 murein hydrolase transporter LrgA [[Haemophilus] ducreyi]AKO35428.1 murein hydrolase transporter LrgA [[Haemophilus] ducreyi]AKO36861.1 murein hydrolase transporter LrgA [[Haemophilus] ducreyi]